MAGCKIATRQLTHEQIMSKRKQHCTKAGPSLCMIHASSGFAEQQTDRSIGLHSTTSLAFFLSLVTGHGNWQAAASSPLSEGL